MDTVLSVISVEGLASGVCVTGGNDERPAIQPGPEPMGNAPGCEHRGPFVDLPALGRLPPLLREAETMGALLIRRTEAFVSPA